MIRLGHVLIGSFIFGAFFAMSISAWYILQKKHLDFAERTFKLALIYGSVVSFSSLLSGHFQADEVAVNQPAKLAALEAHYKTGTGGTEMYIFGLPNSQKEKVDLGLSIPCMLSFLVYQDLSKPVAGLDQFPKADRPPVAIPFFGYHLMVGFGMMFIGLSTLGLFFLKRGTLFKQRWLMWIFVFAVLGAYGANECGWVCAEVGRQPWAVYGLLRTRDAVSHAVAPEEVLASIFMFSFVYALLFIVWVHVLNDKIQTGPETAAEQHEYVDRQQTKLNFWELAGQVMRRGLYPLAPRIADEKKMAGQNEITDTNKMANTKERGDKTKTDNDTMDQSQSEQEDS